MMIDGIKGRRERRRTQFRLVIGEPPREGRNYPIRLNHFALRRRSGGQYWDEVPQFAAATRVRIILTSDDAAKVFRARYLAWRGAGQNKRVACEGNGETATRWNQDFSESKEIACNPATCDVYQKFYTGESKSKLCGPVARLSFQLPGYGLCEYRSGGATTTDFLQTQLEDLYEMSGGLLAGMPCDLVVAPGRVGTDEKGKARISQVVSIEPPSWDDLQAHLRARGVTQRQLVGGAGFEPFEEGDDFPEEFLRGDAGDAMAFDQDSDVVDPETGECIDQPTAPNLPADWKPPAKEKAPSVADALAAMGDPGAWS